MKLLKILFNMINKITSLIGGMSVAQNIVLSFIEVILAGTVLLMLPVSSKNGTVTPFIDSLFTATSAVCVTGLTVVNTKAHWSLFGQAVIITLVEVGGLGLMTIVTMIYIFTGKKITLKERMLIQQSFNQSDIKGMVKLVHKVIIGSLLFELTGAVFLSVCFALELKGGFLESVWNGVFHAIAAFSNAGFDLIGDKSITPFAGNPVICAVIMLLIISGGLGFAVWYDVYDVFKNRGDKQLPLKNFYTKLSLHTKIALEVSFLLLVLGAVFFYISESWNMGTIGAFPVPKRVLNALFQSVTVRTAGFATFDMSLMNSSSKLISIILMFIGGSPGSMAGGVKTTTFAVVIIAVTSVVRGRSSIVAHNKQIGLNVLQKALTVMIMGIFVVITATMLLTFTERNDAYEPQFIDLLFEATSAMSTTGATLGLTPTLTSAGKLVIMACMFLGRIGPTTVLISITIKLMKHNATINYPEGKILVG